MAEDRTLPDAAKSSRGHIWLLVLPAAGAFLLFVGVTGFRIVRAAGEMPAHSADAIVVFGAAEYAGRPSPVYRARLDHGFDLFRKGLAPVVITTGGAAQDPNFSEGGVGRDYLVRRGIPELSLIAETQSSTLPSPPTGCCYHAREWNAYLHRGERRVSRVSDTRCWIMRVYRQRVAPRPVAAEIDDAAICGGHARGDELFAVGSGDDLEGHVSSVRSQASGKTPGPRISYWQSAS
jgi:hypothetical protein